MIGYVYSVINRVFVSFGVVDGLSSGAYDIQFFFSYRTDFFDIPKRYHTRRGGGQGSLLHNFRNLVVSLDEQRSGMQTDQVILFPGTSIREQKSGS